MVENVFKIVKLKIFLSRGMGQRNSQIELFFLLKLDDFQRLSQLFGPFNFQYEHMPIATLNVALVLITQAAIDQSSNAKFINFLLKTGKVVIGKIIEAFKNVGTILEENNFTLLDFSIKGRSELVLEIFRPFKSPLEDRKMVDVLDVRVSQTCRKICFGNDQAAALIVTGGSSNTRQRIYSETALSEDFTRLDNQAVLVGDFEFDFARNDHKEQVSIVSLKKDVLVGSVFEREHLLRN
jgi:hypothetical protein